MSDDLAPKSLAESGEPPTREELPFVARRLMLLFMGFLAVMLVFLTQVYQLTIVEGPTYREISENNFMLQMPLPAPRGRILDRHGEPLAVNQTFFEVQMSPFRLSRAEVTSSLARLAQLLGQPGLVEMTDPVLKLRPRWKTIRLAGNLDLARVLPVMEQSFDLPGIQVTQEYRRYYPAGEMAGLITGHVGSIDKNQIEEYLTRGYLVNEKIGRLGAEMQYEPLLHGEHGTEIVTLDAQGREARARVDELAARPGHTVVLTLDLGLQRLADQLLGTWKGAIIALDPRDGAVLAMVSHPGFDPDRPAWAGSTDHPLTSYNKASSGVFAPGSTFKIVTASGGLLSGYSPDDTTNCDGQYDVPGVRQRFMCNLRSGHGSQNMYEALQHSCNVFFYHWAHLMGGARLLQTARQFGFGAPTGFELTSADGPGYLADAGKKPLLGAVLQMGIGQGELLSVTPLQLARAYAALCNGGILYQPRIFKEERTLSGELVRSGQKEAMGRLPVGDAQRQEILQGLWRVVNEKGGTGARYGIKPEWRVAGKTGTADTGHAKPNGWFVCFAPAEKPEILFLILVEQSGHGGEVCAPVGRQLLAYYFGQPEPEIVPPPLTPAIEKVSTD